MYINFHLTSRNIYRELIANSSHHSTSQREMYHKSSKSLSKTDPKTDPKSYPILFSSSSFHTRVLQSISIDDGAWRHCSFASLAKVLDYSSRIGWLLALAHFFERRDGAKLALDRRFGRPDGAKLVGPGLAFWMAWRSQVGPGSAFWPPWRRQVGPGPAFGAPLKKFKFFGPFHDARPRPKIYGLKTLTFKGRLQFWKESFKGRLQSLKESFNFERKASIFKIRPTPQPQDR